jgi:hypothetical protein
MRSRHRAVYMPLRVPSSSQKLTAPNARAHVKYAILCRAEWPQGFGQDALGRALPLCSAFKVNYKINVDSQPLAAHAPEANRVTWQGYY